MKLISNSAERLPCAAVAYVSYMFTSIKGSPKKTFISTLFLIVWIQSIEISSIIPYLNKNRKNIKSKTPYIFGNEEENQLETVNQ